MENIKGLDDFDNDNLMVSSFDLLFTEHTKMKYVHPKLDFIIDPNKFMNWLELEGEEITGDYKVDCASMCEYGSLYILMLLRDKKLKGNLKMVSGNFGFWGHYWISYVYNGEEYFIDLTLKQFVENAPKLAISKANIVNNGYRNLYYMDVEEYLTNIRAEEFYVNPYTQLCTHD